MLFVSIPHHSCRMLLQRGCRPRASTSGVALSNSDGDAVVYCECVLAITCESFRFQFSNSDTDAVPYCELSFHLLSVHVGNQCKCNGSGSICAYNVSGHVINSTISTRIGSECSFLESGAHFSNRCMLAITCESFRFHWCGFIITVASVI